MPAREQVGTHRNVDFTVTLNVLPGKRFGWLFETSSGLNAKGIGSSGLEATWRAGVRAAQDAIDASLD